MLLFFVVAVMGRAVLAHAGLVMAVWFALFPVAAIVIVPCWFSWFIFCATGSWSQ